MFAVAMVASPGPANMILLTVGLKYGVRKSFWFLVGVIASKQIIIWPIGLSLLTISVYMPTLLKILKYLSIIYIIWLSWTVLFTDLISKSHSSPPRFFSGLLVHPFNPKAWVMVTAGFSGFGNIESSTIYQTGVIALMFFIIQCFFHTVWLFLGGTILGLLTLEKYKKSFVFVLSSLTLISMLYVFFN